MRDALFALSDPTDFAQKLIEIIGLELFLSPGTRPERTAIEIVGKSWPIELYETAESLTHTRICESYSLGPHARFDCRD